jgi:phenylacetate-CoA ligase
MNDDWFDRLGRNPFLLPPAARAASGGAQVLALLAERRHSERLPPTELARGQRRQLLGLARHAGTQSPHFAARLAKAGLTPETLAEPGGLAKLPPLTRRELVGAGEALFCRTTPAAHGQVAATSTSGSTGEPVTVRRTGLCQLHWLAHTLREHLWHRRDFSGRMAISRANIAAPSRELDWGQPCNLVVRTGFSSSMPATSPVAELARWLMDFAPAYLLSLPSSLAGIAAHLEATGRRPVGLRGIRTVSETVTPRLRDEVRRILGVGIADIYSSQEAGVVATQCPEQSAFHVAENIVLEVVDETGRPCQPGETGRILITDLINYATPLVRYEIGDHAEVGEPCPCGRGMPAIKRFLGRERNLVLLPDGSRHWPTVGFHRWDEVYPVRQFQFIQEDRHTVTARLCVGGCPTAEQEARLTAIIQAALGHPFTVRYHWQEEPLPRGPGGKFEEFICRAV